MALVCGLMSGLPANAASPAASPSVPANTVVTLTLDDLHPAQPAVGRDEVLGQLNRWHADPTRWAGDPKQQLRYVQRTIEDKFATYCKTLGQGGLKASFTSMEQAQAARLNDPGTFTCEGKPPASPNDPGYADLATVVAGPDGLWYLTDGHHGMTSLWEAPDGGPALPVRARVLTTIDAPDMASFWQVMAQRGHAWLQTPDGGPLAPANLPHQVRLQQPPCVHQAADANTAPPPSPTGGLADDPYRSLVYFTRNLGYKKGGLPDFAEFHWANWLRAQAQLAVNPWRLSDYQLDVLDSDTTPGYAQAVRDAAQRMRALPADAIVSGNWTAGALGQLAGGEAGDQTVKGTLERLVRSDEDAYGRARTGGKLWYAVRERQHGCEQPLQPPAKP